MLLFVLEASSGCYFTQALVWSWFGKCMFAGCNGSVHRFSPSWMGVIANSMPAVLLLWLPATFRPAHGGWSGRHWCTHRLGCACLLIVSMMFVYWSSPNHLFLDHTDIEFYHALTRINEGRSIRWPASRKALHNRTSWWFCMVKWQYHSEASKSIQPSESCFLRASVWD